MRIALGVEYNGTPYCGWQRQVTGDSVQGRLEAALEQIAGRRIEVTAAGRTDAGVHASAQVVHFDAPVNRPLTAWVRGVNAFLPDTVVVQWARAVEPAFHARFSALSRSYRYVLLNHPVRPGLNSGRTGWYHGILDVDAMQQAADCLLGKHDFSSFRGADCQAHSPVRHLQYARVRREGEQVLFEFTANAFLHHMVRNIVGTLLCIGRGKQPIDWIDSVLAARDRVRAGPTVVAAGLHLCHVQYPEQWALPIGADPWRLSGLSVPGRDALSVRMTDG